MAQEIKKPEEKPKEEFKGKVKITDMREFVTYPRPGMIETMVHISYTTPEGYAGTITMPKKEFTEEALIKKLREELKPEAKLVGKEITL